MAQIFTPGADSLARILLVAIGLSPFLALVGSYVIASSPASTNQGAAPAQPIPFSHQHHVAGLGIDCRYCHAGVEKSAVAGLPPTATCMTCHAHIWTNADMLDPVRKSFADNAPIRWNRVNLLPDYVYFDHSVHIAKGVGCTTCHGEVERMPADASGGAPDHGVVPRLPSPPGKGAAGARQGFRDQLGSAEGLATA